MKNEIKSEKPVKDIKEVKVEIEKISAKDLAVIATATSAIGGKWKT